MKRTILFLLVFTALLLSSCLYHTKSKSEQYTAITNIAEINGIQNETVVPTEPPSEVQPTTNPMSFIESLIEQSDKYSDLPALYLTPPYIGKLVKIDDYIYADHNRRYDFNPERNGSIGVYDLYDKENRVELYSIPKPDNTKMLLFNDLVENFKGTWREHWTYERMGYKFICEKDGWYYFWMETSKGGGSEWFDEPHILYALNKNSELKDFEGFGGVYVKEYKDRLYYLDMKDYHNTGEIYGWGKMYSMDFDGKNVKLIENDIVTGDFYIHNDLIYYVLDGLYTINIDGTGKKAADENKYLNRYIDYTGIKLKFYGDHILVSTPYGDNPAMIGVNGNNYIELPDSLNNTYSFTVVNWDENAVFFETKDGYWIYRVK